MQNKISCFIYPESFGMTVQFFADWVKACCHICDHLLTAPECSLWEVLLREDTFPPKYTDPDDRYRFAKEIWRSDGAAARDIYDQYKEIVQKELREAAALGWVAGNKDQSIQVAMGTTGILILMHDSNTQLVLSTAFIAGAGDASEKIKFCSAEQRRKNPLPRERAGRTDLSNNGYGRGLKLSAGMRKANHRKMKKNRMHDRSIQNRDAFIYYKIFKKSLQFVRSSLSDFVYLNEVDPTIETTMSPAKKYKNDYWRLKDRMPAMKRLKFNDWLEIRKQIGNFRGKENV